MLSIVRHLAASASTGLAVPVATRGGTQAVAPLSSRSWVVDDNTPFLTSNTPLRQRGAKLGSPDPATGPGSGPEAAPACHSQLELRSRLIGGRELVVVPTDDGGAKERALRPGDAKGS